LTNFEIGIETMKGLIVFGILAFLVADLLLSSDSLATTADTSVPDNETASSVNQTHSATLTITMTTPPLPDE
jgi:hypothetical protein